MAKTTNHPPYEIDPWKADTTEPPSGLTFNPEIVETAGKPKQAPVPPEPTEGQLKIEESISRVDRFNNEMNTLREQQEKVLNQVQEGIDETNEKIKQLNDLEEQIKKQVGEYTEETDEKLRQAELLRGELQESKAKMEKAVNDASSAITAAEKAQKALKDYQAGEAKRFQEAINQAQVGVAKAADVNKQIESLKNSLGGEINKQISANETIKKIQSDNKGLNSKLDDALKASKQGVDDAAKAIELLNSNIDIGGSLIALVSGTTTPIWAEKLEKSTETTPDGEEVYVANDVGYQTATKKLVKASDKIEYLVTFWHKSSEPGSKMFLQLSTYDEEGNIKNAVIYRKYKKVAQDGSVSWSEKASGYVVDAVQGDTKWTKHEYVVGLKPGTEFVFFKGLWWNHTSVSVKANQYMGGFRIDPLIPTQADVDRAQNQAIEANSKAIEANSTALKQQEAVNKLNSDFRESQTKLNKTYNAMWDAQGKRNLLQEGIDKSQNEAVIASARASLTPELGNSLVPYATPSDQDILDGKAVWNMPHYALKGNAGWTVSSEVPARGKPTEVSDIGWAIGTKNGDGTMSYHGPDTPCVPGGIYNVEFWGYANSAGSQMYIELRETGTGTHAVEKGTGDTSGGSYIIGGMELKVGWHKYTGTIKIKEGMRSVYINNWYWNHHRGSKSNVQLITGLKIDLAVPSVWDVVNANTLALENQKAINDKQEGIAAAHTKAIDSNRKAIRALAKIDLGGSLLAYMPLTDAEIKKGITREYTPAWAANAANVLDGSKMSGTDSARGYVFLGASGGKAKGEEVYAQVSPGTQYLFEIDVFSPVNTSIGFRLNCSNSKIDRPVKKFMWLEKDEYGGYKVTRSTLNNRTLTISSSDTYQNGYRYLVEFKEGVEDIYVEQVTWTNSTSITVKSLSFAPYTPSQAAIDARQDKALEGLKLAQTLQRQMTQKQQEFTTKLYETSTGIVFLKRDEAAGSISHGVGFEMPSYNTTFKIYTRADFYGNLIVLVNYATGLGDGLKAYRVLKNNLTLAINPNANVGSSIVRRAIFQGEDHYKYYNLNIDSGDVENIIVFIEHITWGQA